MLAQTTTEPLNFILVLETPFLVFGAQQMTLRALWNWLPRCQIPTDFSIFMHPNFNIPNIISQEELFDQILSGLFEFNSPDWDEISYPAKELISWMLQVDPLQRYSAYEILQHPWIKATS